MMHHAPNHITNAAFAAHTAVEDSLRASLCRAPTRAEAAQATAEAYGEALAVYAVAGAEAHQIDEVNQAAHRAYEAMLIAIVGRARGSST
jgi:hypothetical protein